MSEECDISKMLCVSQLHTPTVDLQALEGVS